MNIAKNTAIKDIKKDLQKEGRCFIAFRTELNPIMRHLLKLYINEQKNL